MNAPTAFRIAASINGTCATMDVCWSYPASMPIQMVMLAAIREIRVTAIRPMVIVKERPARTARVYATGDVI